MDKKTKTILIVIAALVVVGGLYAGYNRWRQQQIANQIMKGLYGINAGGVLNTLSNGQIAQEIAKQAAIDEAQQKIDQAKEAAKTPEDKFNEGNETPTYDANSKAIVTEAKTIVDKVFGKSKLLYFTTSAYGGSTGSGAAMLMVPRLATGEDLGAFAKYFTDKGLQIMQSGISDKTASLMANGSDGTIYSVGFEIDDQSVNVTIMKGSK
jgi:hypothetical protein